MVKALYPPLNAMYQPVKGLCRTSYECLESNIAVVKGLIQFLHFMPAAKERYPGGRKGLNSAR